MVITSVIETVSKSLDRIADYKILRKLHIRNKSSGLLAWIINHNRHRILHLLIKFVIGLIHDLCDTRIIEQQIKNFQPDIIYTGHIACLSRAIMPYLADCKVHVVHDEGGSGLIDSQVEKGIWFKFTEEYIGQYPILNSLKSFMIDFVSKLSHHRIKSRLTLPEHMQIIFNSELNYKNAIISGIPVNHATVVHSGISTKKFNFMPKMNFCKTLSIIVPGRIEPQKGQLDAVRLLSRLRENGVDCNLFIVGQKMSSSYYLEIENEMKRLSLEKITVMPMIGQKQLIALYHQSDVCFFPSYHRTGFSRTPLEAMACGCIVFSYGNEGSDEIIQTKQNGFLVPPEAYQDISDIIQELIMNPDSVKNLTYNARKEVEEKYSMGKYFDTVEKILVSAARSG